MLKSTSLADTSLREALFPAEGDPNLAAYAILDGAACPGLLERLEETQPDYCCLYAGELEPDVEEVAPYLVRLIADEPFAEWLLDSIGNKPWGIFCRAPSTLRELRKHFRQFLIVKGPEGENLYFRYYDPRVLGMFFPTCVPIQISNMFGPIIKYISCTQTANCQVYFHTDGILQITAP